MCVYMYISIYLKAQKANKRVKKLGHHLTTDGDPQGGWTTFALWAFIHSRRGG